MKSIILPAIITSVRSRMDRSLGVSFNTPELTPQEKALMMELHGANTILSITPEDNPTPPVEIKAELTSKTPSQRLRSVLFVKWEQSGSGIGFETYYQQEMEKIIESQKEQLDN